jgi:hypothetical protein
MMHLHLPTIYTNSNSINRALLAAVVTVVVAYRSVAVPGDVLVRDHLGSLVKVACISPCVPTHDQCGSELTDPW